MPADSMASVRDRLAQALLSDGDKLYALAFRVTGDRDLAGDVVQEAFRSALEHAGEFRGDAALSTWLYRIVYNRAVDVLRKRNRERPLPDDVEEMSAEELGLARSVLGPLPDNLAEQAEARAAIDDAVRELGPQQRAVFELKEIEGRPTREVAEMLGMTPAHVRVQLHRARLKLRGKLAQFGPQERRS